jgi:hypothetical protein
MIPGIRRPVSAFIVMTLLAPPVLAAEHHVSPTGTPEGDGSPSLPWDLATALSHPPAVQPGDTVWLGGGTYAGAFYSYLRGTAEAPIIVRQVPGERATLDGGDSDGASVLAVMGAYTWYWGFEIMSSDPVRSVDDPDTPIGRGYAVKTNSGEEGNPGNRFINLVIHDAALGISLWSEMSPAIEVYGCLIYYNGWDAPDRGHGHGIYAQNNEDFLELRDNVIFDQFGWGIHVYGDAEAYLRNFRIEGNICFDNGRLARIDPAFRNNLLAGGESGAPGNSLLRGIYIRDNLSYSADADGSLAGSNNVGYAAGCESDISITDNTFAQADALWLIECVPETITGNTFIGGVGGFEPAGYPSNTYLEEKPTGVQVFLRRNAYEPGRAHVVVYNWDRNPAVEVDLSEAVTSGSPFELRDAQNYFGAPVVSGTYDGSPVAVPMTGLEKAAPVGTEAPPHTAPEFAVFVLFTENAPPVEELPPEPPADASIDDGSPDAPADAGNGTGGGEGCGCEIVG